MPEKRIYWEGSLGDKEGVRGWIKDVEVARIVPFNGRVSVGFMAGVQYDTKPAATLKEAKETAEVQIDTLMFKLGARFLSDGEQAIVAAIVHSHQEGKANDEEAFKRILVAEWCRNYADIARFAEFSVEQVERARNAALRAQEETGDQ